MLVPVTKEDPKDDGHRFQVDPETVSQVSAMMDRLKNDKGTINTESINDGVNKLLPRLWSVIRAYV